MSKANTYVSKYFSLKLVMDSSYYKEVAGKVLPVKGRAIQFEQGAYTTSDKDEIEFLENHPNFGSIFIKVEKDAVAERAEYVQTLEERNAQLEAELAQAKAEGKKVDRETPDGDDDGDQYDKMTGPELKEELKSRNLAVSGKVDDLRDRLRENDKGAKF